MNATIVPEMNIPNMDTYWSILKNLSSDMKLELISRLSKSLLSKDQSIDDNWASQFAGEWKDSRSAESIIEDIRNSRTSNREIELGYEEIPFGYEYLCFSVPS